MSFTPRDDQQVTFVHCYASDGNIEIHQLGNLFSNSCQKVLNSNHQVTSSYNKHVKLTITVLKINVISCLVTGIKELLVIYE